LVRLSKIFFTKAFLSELKSDLCFSESITSCKLLGNVHDDQQALDRLLQHFGDPKKDNLGETHAPIVDKIKSLVEYSVLKDVLKRSELSMQEFYRKIVHTNMDMYPNIGKLYQIALICPCTSELNFVNNWGMGFTKIILLWVTKML
jgi:hypothetical protein